MGRCPWRSWIWQAWAGRFRSTARPTWAWGGQRPSRWRVTSMSHTNHRQGTAESLTDCFATLAMAAQGVNTDGASEKLQQYLKIAALHNPVNAGNMKVGNLKVVGSMEKLAAGTQGSIVQAVFNTEEDLIAFLSDLNRADLGISIVVTGLFDQTKRCCAEAGLPRHTVEYSLGIFDKNERLAEQPIM